MPQAQQVSPLPAEAQAPALPVQVLPVLPVPAQLPELVTPVRMLPALPVPAQLPELVTPAQVLPVLPVPAQLLELVTPVRVLPVLPVPAQLLELVTPAQVLPVLPVPAQLPPAVRTGHRRTCRTLRPPSVADRIWHRTPAGVRSAGQQPPVNRLLSPHALPPPAGAVPRQGACPPDSLPRTWCNTALFPESPHRSRRR